MIQYKLIKEYPGSKEIGHTEWYNDTTEIKNISVRVSGNWQGREFYDANPEYWQKVEEVDYEILTVTPSDKNKHNANKEAVITYKICNKDLKFWNIHSVKRLSDGEVFTIGDLIDFGDFGNKGIVPIERFEIDPFRINQISAYNSAYGIGYQIWKKALKKTPLFTTEDGVEIFKGDTYWSVTDDFKLLVTHSARILDYKIRAFSTKEIAKEYILLNKSCLSLNDLLSVWGDSEAIDIFKSSLMFKSFETLAKSKR